MPKLQIFILLIAILLVVAMLQLPKVVVSNKNKISDTEKKEKQPVTSREDDPHKLNFTPEQTKKLNLFKNKFSIEKNYEKKTIFADSIAELFRNIQKPDSAAYYFELLAEANPSTKSYLKAAGAYYEAFSFAVDADKSKRLGEKTRFFYKKVLEENPDNLDAKSNMAMTFTTTQDPMAGIRILQEVLQKDAENITALFNLGLLSMQSRQFEKAIQRFEKILSIKSLKINSKKYLEARIYLAESYANAGKKQEALRIFEEIAHLKEDSLNNYKAAARDYLKQLK